MISRREQQLGYVLHSRPYRESSLLVEYFSREQGRVALLVKGARGRKARGGSLAALLQLFNPLSCSWVGRNELKTLTSCEVVDYRPTLGSSRLYTGMYLNELLVRLLHHEDPHQLLFDEYSRALDELRACDDVEPLLRQFEFSLLEELGYGFEPNVDSHSGDPVDPEGWYYYHPDQGMVPVLDSSSQRLESFRGAELLQLAERDFSAGGRSCAKKLMRQALSHHLGDKPLKSRELFQRLHSMDV